MSRPIIGRDWHGRTRTPRTLEEAFGARHCLHVERPRRLHIDLDWVVGVVCVGILAGVLGMAAL